MSRQSSTKKLLDTLDLLIKTGQSKDARYLLRISRPVFRQLTKQADRYIEIMERPYRLREKQRA